MNPLSDYIVERIRIDNIRSSKFPDNGDLNQIKEFLLDRGFTETRKYHFFSGLLQEFNKQSGRVFAFMANGIHFADTTGAKISENNPIYVVTCSGALKGYWTEYSSAWENWLNKDVFMREINERFGF
jgi:hypothetical protein